MEQGANFKSIFASIIFAHGTMLDRESSKKTVLTFCLAWAAAGPMAGVGSISALVSQSSSEDSWLVSLACSITCRAYVQQ